MKNILRIREVPIFIVFLLFFGIAGLGNHGLFSTSGLHDLLFGSAVV